MSNPRGRPPKITAEEIIAQAATYDLRTISMKQVARDLNVTDAALYHHFPSRDLLIRIVAERLTTDFKLPRRTKNWRRWLEKFSRELRLLLKNHPGAAHYLLVGGPVGEEQLQIIDHALGILIEAGFAPSRAWYTYSTVVNFIIRQANAEEQVHSQLVTDQLAKAASVLPHLSDALSETDIGDREALFSFGLNALLTGIKPA